MSNKYNKIRTGEELEKAINDVRNRRKKLEKGINKDASRLWQAYQPSNLVSGFTRQFLPYLSWTGIGLGLVRGVRKLIAAPGKPKAAKKLYVRGEELDTSRARKD